MRWKYYIPLHDLQGSVALLIDPNTKQAAEEYLYTPFGESSCATSQNPWRYLSKHTDDKTGFIFFGRRYYDPAAGRFLTRDPNGYTDSCNLYAFALNNPFMQIDPYGLENEPSQMTGDTFLSDAGMITVGTMRGQPLQPCRDRKRGALSTRMTERVNKARKNLPSRSLTKSESTCYETFSEKCTKSS